MELEALPVNFKILKFIEIETNRINADFINIKMFEPSYIPSMSIYISFQKNLFNPELYDKMIKKTKERVKAFNKNKIISLKFYEEMEIFIHNFRV